MTPASSPPPAASAPRPRRAWDTGAQPDGPPGPGLAPVTIAPGGIPAEPEWRKNGP